MKCFGTCELVRRPRTIVASRLVVLLSTLGTSRPSYQVTCFRSESSLIAIVFANAFSTKTNAFANTIAINDDSLREQMTWIIGHDPEASCQISSKAAEQFSSYEYISVRTVNSSADK